MKDEVFRLIKACTQEDIFPDPFDFLEHSKVKSEFSLSEHEDIAYGRDKTARIATFLSCLRSKQDLILDLLIAIFETNHLPAGTYLKERHPRKLSKNVTPMRSELMEIFFKMGKDETFPDPLEYLDELEEKNFINPLQRKELESESKSNREMKLFTILATSNHHTCQDMIDIFAKKGYPAADILANERQIIFDKYYPEKKEDKSENKYLFVGDNQVPLTVCRNAEPQMRLESTEMRDAAVTVFDPSENGNFGALTSLKNVLPNEEWDRIVPTSFTKKHLPSPHPSIPPTEYRQLNFEARVIGEDPAKILVKRLKAEKVLPNHEYSENTTVQGKSQSSPIVLYAPLTKEDPIIGRKLGFSKDEITSLARWLHQFGLISQSDRDSLEENSGNMFKGRHGKIFDVMRSKKEKKDKVIRGRLFPALILRLAQQTESKNEFDSLQALANEIILEEYRDFLDWDDNGVLAHGNILGEGGFGLVCTGLLDKQIVAVKTARVSNISYDLEELFQGEFSTLRNLSHRNIVEFRQRTHLENEKPFYVMEYVPAGTLDRFWTEPTGRNFAEKITQDTKLSIAKQLWDGVAYLHEQNIVHQDIKPGNVLVTFDYVPKLCDFGFSKFVADLSRSESSVSNHNPGTRKYNPPEIELSSRRIRDSKVNIWMAGITIMYLFCEKFLFGDFYGEIEHAQLMALYRLATGPFGMIFEMERRSRLSADLPVSVGNFAWTDERISKLAEDISISPSNLKQLQEYDTDPNRRESDAEIMNQIKSFFKCTAQLNSLEDDSPLLLQNFPSVINLASHPTESWDRNLVLQLGLRPLKWRYSARPRASEMQQIYCEELEKRHRV